MWKAQCESNKELRVLREPYRDVLVQGASKTIMLLAKRRTETNAGGVASPDDTWKDAKALDLVIKIDVSKEASLPLIDMVADDDSYK